MHIGHDNNGTEEEYFLDDYTESSEWEVLNVHKVYQPSLSISASLAMVDCELSVNYLN